MELTGGLFLVILLIAVADQTHRTAAIANREIKKMEHCQLDTFRAECDDDEVLLVTSALYGRMKVGKCVKRDWGYIGCKSDVLAHVDRVCSGRRTCEFPVADLDGNQVCPSDLAPYLETVYQCLPVVLANSQKCNVHEPITVADPPSGYLASGVTIDTGRGGQDCPWRIQVHQGQQVNVTLLNFARIGLPSEWGTSAAPRPKICYQLARIRERQYSRTLTECEGSSRESHAFTSTANVIEIDVIVAKIHKVYFLLHYEAIGCSNPPLQPGMWLTRDGDSARVRCNSTGVSWSLRCVGASWEGQLENCTQSTASASSVEGWNVGQLFVNEAFPYSILIVVSVGVALGVFVGGVLLVCAARYFKRRHDGMTSEDDYCHGSCQPEAAKTLVLSCEVISPTSNDDPTIVSPFGGTDLTQLHHTSSSSSTQQRLKQLKQTGPTAGGPGLPGPRGAVECHCPYAVYDSFPCSPHGCLAAVPPPGPGAASTLISGGSASSSATTGGGVGVGGGGGGGGGMVSRRIQLQRGTTHIYDCSPQPELLGCLT